MVNVSKEEPAPPGKPVAEASTTATTPAPAPAPPPAPLAAAFPAKADYVGKIPTANGTITLDITIEGDKAVAYACDGNSIESWLRGSSTNGALSFATRTRPAASRVGSRATPSSSTLSIHEGNWDFKADPARPPAGLYVYDNAGVEEQLDHRRRRGRHRRAAPT